MARISGTAGPSNAQVALEVTLLKQQGKVDKNGNPVEFGPWKVS